MSLYTDAKMAWRESGEGPAIVLLHGQLVTHVDWPDDLIEDLARNHRVIVFDRPGYGQSLGVRFSQDPRAQASQIHETLNDLGVVNPTIVGHSFGGIVALAYASMYEVRAMVLLAPLVFPELRFEHLWLAPRATPFAGPMLSKLALLPSAGLLGLAQVAMFAPQLPPADWLRTFPYRDILNARHLVSEGEETASMHPMSPLAYFDFSTIGCPVHILMGQLDCIARNERHGMLLGPMLARGRVSILAGAGHMLHHSHTGTVYDAVTNVMDEQMPPIEGDRNALAVLEGAI